MVRSRRDALGWILVAGSAISAVAPWVGRLRWRWATALRALMPWSALAAGPLAAGAALTGRRPLATAAATVAASGVAMAAPLVIPRRQPPVDTSARPVRIVHSNLLYINRRIRDVPGALAAHDADVITFSELTPTFATELDGSRLAQSYPHRMLSPASFASGTGLWSRYPLTGELAGGTRHHTLVADIEAPGGPVRVIVLHTQSPIIHHAQWEQDLARLAELPADRPAVMTGDFNASWWHPELRHVLRQGWRDAHLERGRGLSASWPTDRWHPVATLHPPFVRLDHALVSDGLAVLDVTDFAVPGSDHVGLMVTVQRARRAAP